MLPPAKLCLVSFHFPKVQNIRTYCYEIAFVVKADERAAGGTEVGKKGLGWERGICEKIRRCKKGILFIQQ